MSNTRTGHFPIGFRRVNSAWQKDLEALLGWAKGAGFSALDLMGTGDLDAPAVFGQGLHIGSVDLPEWQGLISPDGSKREAAIRRNAQYIEKCSGYGVSNFFLVLLPEDSGLERRENFGYMLEGLSGLLPALEKNGARIVIEGWPGPGALCCTPETCRALFEEIGSPVIGLNYDPSHLIRMGIDPIRFLKEFLDRVYHVHAKDTVLFEENYYEFGNEQPPTFAKKFSWGGMVWRYAIPGSGVADWETLFGILKDAGYEGVVSIELEDADYNGSEEGEKEGLQKSLGFLQNC